MSQDPYEDPTVPGRRRLRSDRRRTPAQAKAKAIALREEARAWREQADRWRRRSKSNGGPVPARQAERLATSCDRWAIRTEAKAQRIERESEER